MSLSSKSGAVEFPGSGDKGRRRKRRELSDEQKQEVVEAFNLFDTDKDQAIDYHELKVKSINSLSLSLSLKKGSGITCVASGPVHCTV